jgi:lipoate-protein ligase A
MLSVLLWRNAPSVVIGRHQNPWTECHLDAMARDRVQFVRRPSGGGAVYHDLGNWNVSFVAQRADYSVARQVGVLVDALHRLDIDATATARNDVLVGGRKVSGSAYRGRGTRWLHHATLLVDSDLARLRHYLLAPPADIESKGVASVRASVVNLSTCAPRVDVQRVRRALLDALDHAYGCTGAQPIDPRESVNGPEFAAAVVRLRDDAWRFGRTPAFVHRLSHRFAWGMLHLDLGVRRNRVESATLTGDGVPPILAGAVAYALPGAAYRRDDLARRVLEGVPREFPERPAALDFAAWLARALPRLPI